MSKFLQNYTSTEKEECSMGDLDLTLSLSNMVQPHGVSASGVPKNLSDDMEVTLVGQETDRMTILYGGRVYVYNDVPADKASEIMGLASNAVCSENPALVHPPQPLVNDLQLARHASLAKFFEKRKNRMVPRALCQTSNSVAATSRPENKKWW